MKCHSNWLVTGWIAVDPSDVRKKTLVDKLELADIKELREYFLVGLMLTE
ncbi:hypothetical protein [Methyloprofundus sedimenti]|nr:hypothetical protein [Methyloprofundus sedimenti]